MSEIYFCRVGRHGQVGRFYDVEKARRERHQEVIVRTARGVEVGEILGPASEPSSTKASLAPSIAEVSDGKILRKATAEDRLLHEELLIAAEEAFENCQRHLTQVNSRDCLVEVEPMLDGKTLYFHFVGTPGAELTEHLQGLTEVYRETAQASRFARLLDEGCGPGCGSEEKGSCGDGGHCSVCVVAKACKK